jgi:uncharacterized protein (DUF1684 family)
MVLLSWMGELGMKKAVTHPSLSINADDYIFVIAPLPNLVHVTYVVWAYSTGHKPSGQLSEQLTLVVCSFI